MTTIQKNDFIEIEFTGKANGEIFDTTDKEEVKNLNPDIEVKPMIISVGNQMVLKGFDEALEGKEINKPYSIHITPEKAFGKRDPSLIRTIPMRVFREKNINPERGMTFQIDNYMTKILSVSGGRIIADFNNPLAGKEIDYDFKIIRKITDIKEKVNSLQEFFFKQTFEFTINEKDKKIIFKNKEIAPIIQMMSPKFKEMTGFDYEVKEEKQTKENKK